ncbi:MAG: hypothetical protein KatS3mg017_0918 [Fimbriimonadales bacterium]|nr:MAG: hypothetical protein KatS3mg017_0918 [Fimbriimonadales bacterium]
MGFVWKVEHKKADGTLLIGYEYTYDLLGRVEQSVERPSGDVTAYTYTPAGRLESEGRTGQVAYSRSYAYNPDGSRAFVIRDDAVNGSHWDFYAYDAVSGRLESVLDVWTGEVNSFVWNPGGMLTSLQAGERYIFYDYSEEGQVVAIRLADRSSSTLIATYEYNSDGRLVSISDSAWELRLSCGSICRDMPLRTYGRKVGASQWQTLNVSLLDRRGRLVSTHKMLTEEDMVINEILWVHYGMWNIAMVTNQSGSIVTRSGESGHCDRLKEELLSLLPSGCKTRLGILPCALPPADCRRFNDLLYRFCYECKDNLSFVVDCDRFAEWYYKYSGCKPGAPFPGSPFLPPIMPGNPVAPPPSPSPPLIPAPCRGKQCGIPIITSPEAPPSEPCPIHNPVAHFICTNRIANNPASCAQFSNGLRGGDLGHQLCLACCEMAAQYYGWSQGQIIDCRNACDMFNPSS